MFLSSLLGGFLCCCSSLKCKKMKERKNETNRAPLRKVCMRTHPNRKSQTGGMTFMFTFKYFSFIINYFRTRYSLRYRSIMEKLKMWVDEKLLRSVEDTSVEALLMSRQVIAAREILRADATVVSLESRRRLDGFRR